MCGLLTSQGLCRRQSARSLRPEANFTSTMKIKLKRPTYQSKRRQIQVDCLSQVWKVDEAGMDRESVHLSDQPIIVQPSFTSGSQHLHFICCWFTRYVPSFSFTCVKTLTRVDGGVSAIRWCQCVSRFIHLYQEPLCVIADTPSDPSLFSTDMLQGP